MKLYTFDGSPTSRMALLFCTEEGIEFEKVDVDLLCGAHLSDSFKKVNPCALVPVMEDGDFRLTESSAILKYLADKHDSRTYPRDLKRRAKIHELMDWLNTSLYRVMGYNFIYRRCIRTTGASQRRSTRRQSSGAANARGNAFSCSINIGSARSDFLWR